MQETLPDPGVWRTLASIGVLAVLLAWESLAPFLPIFTAGTAERVRHGLKNVALGLLNALLIGFGFAVLWGAVAGWAQEEGVGLLNWLVAPGWLRIVVVFLLFDAWMYWWHRLNHRVPFLWRFHRTHHSDPSMDVTTASRFHVGEIVLSSVLRVPVIALIGLRLEELVLYEVTAFAVVQLHHANIALPARLDGAFRALVVTPFMHKVHHSRLQKETDSNYSSLLSLWDRLFRTFRLRDDPTALRFGLDELDRAEDQTLLGLLSTPLRQLQGRATALG